MRTCALPLSLGVALLFGCDAGGTTDDGGSTYIEADPFKDFLGGGKEDTGYVGDRAVELEATLSSRVVIDLSDKTPEEQAAELERATGNARAVFWSAVTNQVKHARIQLKRQTFQMNLERGDASYEAPEAVDGGIAVDFSIDIDTLVKLKDLEEGQNASTLVGRKTTLLLPLDPAAAFEAGAAACASDDSGQPVAAEDLEERSYFYYFDPAREGCPLKDDGRLFEAQFEVRSSLDAPPAYPELDLLVEDGQITMAAVFGQVKHGELDPWDWGWIAHDDFERGLDLLGFSRTELLGDEETFGEVYERTYPGDLVVTVKLYNPASVAEDREKSDVDALFKELLLGHELVYYNGHSFYGSLSVLRDAAAYPEDTYQVVFMDSCWSYAYYTKQVFESKATDDDPEGTRWADVVNNTEPGITGSHETAFLLYRTLFDAASALAAGGNVHPYSWLNLVRFMNQSADERARRRTTHTDPEIYGVSGARDNAFKP